MLSVQFGGGGTAQAAWLWPFSLIGRGASSTALAEQWISTHGSSLPGCWLLLCKQSALLLLLVVVKLTGRWDALGPLEQGPLHAGIAAILTSPACVTKQ